jgi:hypothetical protein
MRTNETYAVNGLTPSDEYSIYPTRCGALTPVAASSQLGYWNQGEIFYQLRVEAQGNLIVEGKDGFPLYFASVSPGEIVITCGRRILDTATIDGVDVITTVTGNIWVYGGK